MAQSEAQKARRAAQRKLAAQLKRGESPLGGEFKRYVERATERIAPPPPVGPYEPPVEELDYESIAADQFASGFGDDDDIPLTYRPTNTSWPGRPGNRHRRTTAAGYARNLRTLAVQFYTNGAVYHYYDVSPGEARAFYLTDSPGDMINGPLSSKEYERIR